MSDAGRNLADLFNAAEAKLDRIVKEFAQRIGSDVETALLVVGDQETVAYQRLVDASDGDLREIDELTEECLESVRSSMIQLMDENESFINLLKEEMLLHFRGLQQRISDETESLLRSHVVASKVQRTFLAEHGNKEQERLQLEGLKARDTLREQEQTVGTEFGEDLLQCQSRLMVDFLEQERGVADQVPALLARSASKIAKKEADFRALHKQHQDELESDLTQAGASMEALIQAQASRLEEQTNDARSLLRGVYDRVTGNLFQTCEASARDCYGRAQQEVEFSESELKQVSGSLTRQMEDFLRDLAREEERSFDAFMVQEEQLKSELLSLIEQQRLIPSQSSTIFAQILDELDEIEKNFDARMTGSLVKQLSRIEEHRDAAIQEVLGEYKGVSAKLAYLQKSAIKQVQESEAQALKAIENRLERAKLLIKAAVAGE